ncbi:MAG: DNA topology modulation protein FlaR [Pseudomonadota bacterium]
MIGSAGSGKSTAARMLGKTLGLPVFHMDREVFWLPGWVERDKADQLRQIERIVALEDWVFEGNNSSTFAIREARAQMLVWLDIPLWLRLVRVVRRSWQQRGQSRPDMSDGCVERLRALPGFLHFIVSTSRSSRRKQRAFFERTLLAKHRFADTARFNAYIAGLAR